MAPFVEFYFIPFVPRYHTLHMHPSFSQVIFFYIITLPIFKLPAKLEIQATYTPEEWYVRKVIIRIRLIFPTIY